MLYCLWGRHGRPSLQRIIICKLPNRATSTAQCFVKRSTKRLIAIITSARLRMLAGSCLLSSLGICCSCRKANLEFIFVASHPRIFSRDKKCEVAQVSLSSSSCHTLKMIASNHSGECIGHHGHSRLRPPAKGLPNLWCEKVGQLESRVGLRTKE